MDFRSCQTADFINPFFTTWKRKITNIHIEKEYILQECHYIPITLYRGDARQQGNVRKHLRENIHTKNPSNNK